ncbi:MAG: hypothetical protein VW495_07605, partial [Rhodobiaceae bacterium]
MSNPPADIPAAPSTAPPTGPPTGPFTAPSPAGLELPTSTLDFMRVEWRFLLFGMAMAFCSSLG